MALELQNISVFFTENRVTSYYQETIFEMPLIAGLTELREGFELAYGIVFDAVTVQLLDHYSEPRIIPIAGGVVVGIITLVDVATNHTSLYSQLQAMRLLIEAEITAQIG